VKLAFVFAGQRVDFEQSAKAFDADRAGSRRVQLIRP
jgi:hypothetical protein